MGIGYIAANLRSGPNPNYNVEDFLVIYPQFGEVPREVLEMYVEMAHQSILKSRWHSKWRVAMGLYIAHFVTLWAMTAEDGPLTPGQLSESGESKGAVMSKSVDGVSVSYGATSADSDLVGWGSYKDTLYGQQFATLSKLVGYGGMYVL